MCILFFFLCDKNGLLMRSCQSMIKSIHLLVSYAVSLSTDQQISQSISQSQLVSRSISQSVSQSANQLDSLSVSLLTS